jgi:hypothetical protein
MTPLQKRALYSLLAGLVMTAVLIGIILTQGGITILDGDSELRLLVYAVLIGVPLIYLILVNLTLRRPEQFDERDRRVIERSARSQWLAAVLAVVAWTIILTEKYHISGQIPVEFMFLIVFSILVISPLAQSLGILTGYRSLNRHD